jgi:hypothetical protein
MKQRLDKMTVDQLVDQFLTIALDQDRAIRDDNNAKYNRLYDQLEAVRQELRRRPKASSNSTACPPQRTGSA